MTKTDLMKEKLDRVLEWSSDDSDLENEIAKEVDGETLSLISDMLRSLNKNEFIDEFIPISNVTGDGLVELESALSRTINLGEEVED